MVYEVYADSLFLVNFGMNIYLLLLVNRKLLCTATHMRLVLGAGAGAAVYVLAFAVQMPALAKGPLFFLTGTWIMLEIAFRPRTVQVWLAILRQLCHFSFLTGGILLILQKAIPVLRHNMAQIGGVLGAGAILCAALLQLLKHERQKKSRAACKVHLLKNDKCITLWALVDSGNSLYEPISGKPVSIIGEDVFRTLWEEEPAFFRVIPFHSIGRKNGILRGYLLPAVEVETEGGIRRLEDIYVAVSASCRGKMILHPRLLDAPVYGN
ncbi:MAG: sigma-E processing peptidase SpoIIGA [Lachnospiraceae bacterium]|nr:sigma-E processing peptidase SpoIIGA [Lachnospiraceae bacterium]